MLKIYLDACCYNRPFDDQSFDRIRLETEAIIYIFKKIREKKLKLMGSEVLSYEINKISDPDRKYKIDFLLKNITKTIILNENIKQKALVFENIGFSGFDALHIASAGIGKSDVFLTTDDKLLKLYKRNKSEIDIIVENPLIWITELLTI
ncbi:MAG TPA: PIN domain-containing protein [Spirochaetota bacterium]|nr:PIN domain-containing protein [Spirochaetota bacterium]